MNLFSSNEERAHCHGHDTEPLPCDQGFMECKNPGQHGNDHGEYLGKRTDQGDAPVSEAELKQCKACEVEDNEHPRQRVQFLKRQASNQLWTLENIHPCN